MPRLGFAVQRIQNVDSHDSKVQDELNDSPSRQQKGREDSKAPQRARERELQATEDRVQPWSRLGEA